MFLALVHKPCFGSDIPSLLMICTQVCEEWMVSFFFYPFIYSLISNPVEICITESQEGKFRKLTFEVVVSTSSMVKGIENL